MLQVITLHITIAHSFSILNILFVFASFDFQSFEKLLGMRSDLSATSSLHQFFHFLPVLAIQFYSFYEFRVFFFGPSSLLPLFFIIQSQLYFTFHILTSISQLSLHFSTPIKDLFYKFK